MKNQPPVQPGGGAAPFRDGLDHLLAELAWIRRDLEQRIQQATRRFDSEENSPCSAYGITPTEVMNQLRRADAEPNGAPPSLDPARTEALAPRVEASLARGVPLPLDRLRRLFGLSRFELDILLTCLLPDFYPGFERVFGFIQDDATRTHPTVGFFMETLRGNPGGREIVWRAFHAGSPMMSWGLIAPVGGGGRLPLLKRAFHVDERIITHLLGSDLYDGKLEGAAALMDVGGVDRKLPGDKRVDWIVNTMKKGDGCALVSLSGNDVDGAEAFVKSVSRTLGWRLLKCPVSVLVERRQWRLDLVDRLLREAVLQPATILLHEEDPTGESLPGMGPFLRRCGRKGMLLFYLGRRGVAMEWGDLPIRFTRMEFNAPDASERVRFWRRAIEREGLGWSGDVVEQLAMRYPLSEKKVHETLGRLARFAGDGELDEDRALTMINRVIDDRARGPLDELAQRIEPAFDWEDLVVHGWLADHLKAFRNTIANQFTVYEKWGVGEKTPRGRGAAALFSGSSGTGKTMAAEVIARDLGLNLYRVDLADLVSKYIGETEKNIKKIFLAARGADTLLFFDEADALFGRRTEIRDSHDRYANLEVNYLLQSLEEHDGPVILATNRKKNMDEAFLRRIHFIVEFPRPSEALRRILWQKKLPPSAPRTDDVDFSILARHFEISGGDIKNAAVQAAFMAASDGRVVTMSHLLLALKREYLKLGKLFPGARVNHLDPAASDSPEIRRRKKEVRRLGS